VDGRGPTAAVAAEREVRRVELQLHNRLAAVFEQYANARMRAEKYKGEILPKAKESLELTRKAYQQGESGFLNLLTAQRTYFRVNLAYLDSLRELCTSHVAIKGLLLSGGPQTEAEPCRPDGSCPNHAVPLAFMERLL
jgi:cobalt-zinc-cadmium efflux system outer membrane protein